MAVELEPVQLEAVRNLHNGSILKGGTGTGKTRTSLLYYYVHIAGGRVVINGKGTNERPESLPHLYVITTAKTRDSGQWIVEAARFGLSSDDITVDSWNNVSQYADVDKAFFIFDEQRLVGNGTWVRAFYKIASKNRWIMLSATPGDNWMDYIPIFIANGFYKNRTEFLRRHVAFVPRTTFPKIDHYMEEAHLEALKHRLIVEMPFIMHTTRHVYNMMVDYDQAKWDRITKDRWNIFEDRPIKDVSEMFICLRKLINSDVSRSGALMKLMEKHPKLIVFYNYNFELEMLRVVALSTMMHKAEWNGHKHEDIPETDAWLYFVQYTAGAEGWNCTETDAVVFWSLNYSYKLNEQAKGRIDRLNTPFTDLYYYILRSMSPLDNGIVQALAQKRNFNTSKFMLAA
jgi:hypothetical protein